MGTIITPDPYLENYVVEKQLDPSAPIVWRKYKRRMVEQADRIVELAHGNRDVVKSSKDWEIVEELVKFFATEWPGEYNEFKKTIPDIRGSRRAGGYSESGEIKYLGAMPARLIKLIQAIFPFQNFDKSFMNKFVRKFPLFKVGGVGNMSKGVTIL